MSDRQRFRTGDVVRHDGDEYVLACDEERGEAWPAGWPCSPVKVDECELVKAASDDERDRMLRAAVEANERGSYWPGVIARLQLEAAEPRPWQPKPVTHEWDALWPSASIESACGWKVGLPFDIKPSGFKLWKVAIAVVRPIEPSERGDR